MPTPLRSSALFRRAKRLVFLLSLGYLALTALLFFNQRNVLFQPYSGPETPEAAGLPGYHLAYFTSHDNLTIPYWYHPPKCGNDAAGAPTGATMQRSGMREGDSAPEGRWTRSEAQRPQGEHRQNDANQLPQAKRGSGETPSLCERSEPLILYFHGNGGGLHAFTHPLKRLADQGYAVAAMEYRGFPGAPGAPTEADIIADAKSFAALLTEKHPKRPLVLWGYSLGSGIATQLAAHLNTEQVVILEAPFTAAVDRASELYPYLPVHTLMKDHFDSKAAIPHLNSALFLMHGQTDRIVPASHSKRLYDAASAPKKRIVYRKGDHFNLDEQGGYDATFAFIQRYTHDAAK